MSKIVVNNTTRTVSVYQTGWRGIQGKPGLTWRDDAWQVGNEYAEDDALLHDGSSYRARMAHIATAETEPGTGADWESVWKVLALGTDVETAEKVAGIADAIETVAGISEAIQTVAENRQAVVIVAGKVDDVATVAGRIEDVSTVAAADEAIRITANRDAQIAIVAERDAAIALVAEKAEAIETTAGIAGQVVTVADNVGAVVLAAEKIAEIEAAPGAAEAAGQSAGAAGQSAQDAAGSAAIAAAATLIEYGVNLYHPEGVPSGGWPSKRYTPFANTQKIIFAEIEGVPGSQISVVVLAGDDPVYGPFTVSMGERLVLTDLDIFVGTGKGVTYMITASAGVYRVAIESNGKLL